MRVNSTKELLFSYGTLQQKDVQMATFGRLLKGSPARLLGYRLEQLEIRDPAVVATSGKKHHPMLVLTNDGADEVVGTVFSITPQELAHADAYEVADYQRVQITLSTGRTAWVYADARASSVSA